jgi:hypothetical protein
MIDAILGHEVNGSTGAKVYTHRTLAQMKAAMERVAYPSVVLPRLNPHLMVRESVEANDAPHVEAQA